MTWYHGHWIFTTVDRCIDRYWGIFVSHYFANEALLLDLTSFKVMLLFELFDPLLNCRTFLLLFFRLLDCISKHVIDRVNDRWLLRHSHRPPLLFVSLPPKHLFFGLVNIECLALKLPIWSKEQLHLLGLLLSVLLLNTLSRPFNVNAHLQIAA